LLEGRWHYDVFLLWTPEGTGTIDDVIHGRHVGKRAADTIDDFIQGAIWMDASEEGRAN
jgi:hypothetical protein